MLYLQRPSIESITNTISVVGLSVFAREQVGHDIISSHYQL